MSGGRLGAVALSVFRESVRDRVFYNLLLFAVLLVGASVLVGQMTAGQDIKIIKDLGLAATSLFGLFIAVFIGVGLVWKEVDRRSVYNLLVKPIRRHEFIAGTDPTNRNSVLRLNPHTAPAAGLLRFVSGLPGDGGRQRIASAFSAAACTGSTSAPAARRFCAPSAWLAKYPPKSPLATKRWLPRRLTRKKGWWTWPEKHPPRSLLATRR